MYNLKGRYNSNNLRTNIIQGFGTNSPVVDIDLVNPKITFNLQTDTDVVLQRTDDAKPQFKTHTDRFYIETGATDGQRVALATDANATMLTSTAAKYNLSSTVSTSSLAVSLADAAGAAGCTINKTTLAAVGAGSNSTEMDVKAARLNLIGSSTVQLKTPQVEVIDPLAPATRKVAFSHDLAADKLVINTHGDYTEGVSVPSSLAVKTDALAVTKAGFVGVGTLGPVSKFHVSLPSDVETHDVQKFVLTSSTLVDLKSTAINFCDPAVTTPHQAFKHDVNPNVLRVNNLLDFASVNFGTDSLTIDSLGKSKFNSTALTVIGSQVGINTDAPKFPLDVAADARIRGELFISKLSADAGKDLVFRSPNTITLDAPKIEITGTFNVINKTEVDIEDYLLVLAKNGNNSDATLDGSGIKLDHAFDNLPAGVEPATVEQSLRWRAKSGWYNVDGTAVAIAKKSRWELGGGNFMIKGPGHCSFMFAVDPTSCELQLFKVFVNPVSKVETQTLIGVFGEFNTP